MISTTRTIVVAKEEVMKMTDKPEWETLIFQLNYAFRHPNCICESAEIWYKGGDPACITVYHRDWTQKGSDAAV